ncbi:MAG: LysM peptidoglycan-binding domain-containing protein [Caldilineaceae bacterium]
MLAQDPTSPSSAAVQVIAQAINQQRANVGLPPLNLHPLLNQAAQNHAEDMVNSHVYGHIGSDGSYVRQRVERLGYASGGLVSENWVSANDADGAMNWWMSDWIHRQNILNPTWRELGVGVAGDPSGGLVFVTDFTAGSDGTVPVSVAPEPAAPQAIPAEGLDYTIQSGDTLLAIAYRYGIDWTMIAEANKLHEDALLQIGQVLHLPGVHSVGGPVEEKAAAPNAAEAQPKEKHKKAKHQESDTASQADANAGTNSATDIQLYTVQPGNTLLDIAGVYGVSWEAIAKANDLTENSVLAIGQELRIPVPAEEKQAVGPQATPDAKSDTQTTKADATSDIPSIYTVQSGDTIISIAVHYGLDWEVLLKLNGLTESTILELDQKIRLK